MMERGCEGGDYKEEKGSEGRIVMGYERLKDYGDMLKGM